MAEENESGTGGAGDAGTSGAAGATAAAKLQADLDAANERLRAEAQRADRNATRAKDLEAKLEAASKTEPPAAPSGVTEESLMALLDRRQALQDARARLSQEFGSARNDVLHGNYSTPEELEVAVRKSHDDQEAYIAKVRQEQEAAVRAEFKAKHGYEAPQAPAAGEGEGSQAQLTARDIAVMNPLKMLELSDDEVSAALSRS